MDNKEIDLLRDVTKIYNINNIPNKKELSIKDRKKEINHIHVERQMTSNKSILHFMGRLVNPRSINHT